MSTGPTIAGQYLADNQRSAYGLGWEFRRREKEIDVCDLLLDPFRVEQARKGWQAHDDLIERKR